MTAHSKKEVMRIVWCDTCNQLELEIKTGIDVADDEDGFLEAALAICIGAMSELEDMTDYLMAWIGRDENDTLH